MILKNIFIVVLFLFVQQGQSATQEESEAICGPKPIGQKLENQQINNAKILERTMPPISNQNPASWCYAFVANDALNYHNYLQTNINKGRISYSDFYQSQNMISPIESVYSESHYKDSNTNPRPTPFARLDMKKGGSTYRCFLGFQGLSYQARSLNQIPFNSLDEHNTQSKRRVADLIKFYSQKNKKQSLTNYIVAGQSCPEHIYKDQRFKVQIENFEQINSWLSSAASHNNLKVSEYAIDRYEDIAQLKGAKDISIFPFITHNYASNNKIHYLKKLRETLYPNNRAGYPVSIGICSVDINSAASASQTTDGCGNHAVNIIGAYYENGSCVVRLRNSWGANWNNDGHISVPLDKYLSAISHYARFNNLTESYSATWIGQEKTPPPRKPRTTFYDGNNARTGEYREEMNNDSSYHPRWSNDTKILDR